MAYYNAPPSVSQMTADIIAGARRRRMDPNIAVRAASGEALNGPWQSQIYNRAGRQENSFSPWQLNTDSPGAVGSQFQKTTGLDPRDPKNWPQMNDFALDHAQKNGWGDWMGARAKGVTGYMGINGQPQTAPNSPIPQGYNINNPIDPTTQTPMAMAMNGGIPGGAEQFQMAGTGKQSTPMATAMQPQPMTVGPATTAPKPEDSEGYDWGAALIGAGAGLSSIDNPGGAAVAASLLKERKSYKNRYSTQQTWDGAIYRTDRDSGDVTMVRGPNDIYAAKKQGIPDADSAAANLQGSQHTITEMTNKINTLANDPDLGWIAGGLGQLPTGFGEYSFSKGKAAKLQGVYDSLMSQGTLDEVKRLKESSTTLGQISNYEDSLFQKAFLPINPGMKEEDLRATLLEKAKTLQELQQIRNEKYKALYGRDIPDTPGTGTPYDAATDPPAGVGDSGASGFKILKVE